MKYLGLVLVIVGLVALVYGGISYTRDRTILKVGSLSLTSTAHRNIPVPALAGAAFLVEGTAFLVLGRRHA